jgi:hypothetical protein
MYIHRIVDQSSEGFSRNESREFRAINRQYSTECTGKLLIHLCVSSNMVDSNKKSSSQKNARAAHCCETGLTDSPVD